LSRIAPIELLEREDELARLMEFVDGARAGTASLGVIEGPAGIGKSTLLRAAMELAARRDVTVLTARGTELETSYSFGVAVQLIESVLVGSGPERRERAFAGAAALARPLFESGNGTQQLRGDAGFRTLHGLYWLFVNLSQETPLFVVVDDVQWADVASLRFLAFIVKRLEGLPLSLALALRAGEAPTDATLIDSLLTDPLASTMRPRPLSSTAVGRLVRERLAGQPDEVFVTACHMAAGGNPFLTSELLADLARRGVEPTAAHVRELAEVTPAAIARSVLARIVRLGEEAEAFALACAVLGEAASLRHAAALAGVEEAAAGRAADALAAASILEPGGSLAFAHPVLRGAVHSEISPRERASAHARAARLLAADGAPVEEVAAQLLLSEPAGDPIAVDVLASAGSRALAQGAPDVAVSYLRRGLAEQVLDSRRATLLRDLGTAESALGEQEAAIEHLRAALEHTEGLDRVGTARTLAVTLLSAGRIDESVAVLGAEIERVGPGQRELVLQLEAELVGIASQGGMRREVVEERLAKHRGLLAGNTPGERMFLAVSAYDLVLVGGKGDEAVALARRALAGDALLREHTADSPPYWTAVLTLIVADNQAEADRHIHEGMLDARDRGSVLGRAIGILARCVQAQRAGDIRDLETHASETLELARLARWRPGLAYGVGYLAQALVDRAELAGATRLLEEHGMSGDLPPLAAFDLVLLARAQLALAKGHPRDALVEAETMARRQEMRGVRSAAISFDWRAPAVLANVRLGRRRPALELAEDLLSLARAWGRPGTLGRALHIRALAEGDDSILVKRLREVIELTARSEFRYHHAPALVDLGAALRRLRRPSEARVPLRAGLEIAERSGAKLVADRARAELEASGERRRKTQWLSGIDSLTPSERRVAEMAAQAMSNKEIAQALFVTLKTVEVHLTQTYRKLGISSRSDLPAALTMT
jgi:DNA-binding CsgD family transcriptional regulator